MTRNGRTLVDIPSSLMRPDLDRRLPSGNRFVDYTGTKYEQCEVLGLAGFLGQFASYLYRCKCGNQFIGRGAIIHFKGGHTCGCAHRNNLTPAAKAVVQTWRGMLVRCYTRHSPAFPNYGGRGIGVCPRWLNSVEAFAQDMGPRPSKKHSIERTNNNGDYCPDNCRWATPFEQAQNTRANRYFELNGVRMTMTGWAYRVGVTRERMRQRVNTCIERGIDIAEALTTPPGQQMPSVVRRVPTTYKKQAS